MKKFICFLMSFFLLSCASTPDQVVSQGDKFTFKSGKPARLAAECLSKSSDNLAPNLVSKVQSGAEEGAYEVVVHSTRGDGGTMFVFLVEQEKSAASKIEAYVTNKVFVPSGKAGLVSQVVEACK